MNDFQFADSDENSWELKLRAFLSSRSLNSLVDDTDQKDQSFQAPWL